VPSLVADIGGTNTRVALAEDAALIPGSVQRFRNADHPDLSDVLAKFLSTAGSPKIAGACAALAGPVRNGRGRLTNFDWTIDEAGIAEVTGARHVKLLNDLQAQGHALDHLEPDAVEEVLGGAGVPGEPRLVIGVGTGFNSTTVYPTPAGTLVTAAESGQISLPVADALGLSLAKHVAGADGFACVEDVLSGRGIEAIFAWVTEEAGTPRRIAGRDILISATEDPHAGEALRVFVHMLGRVTGDLALAHLPYGGIYLIGGMARAVTPHLVRLGFSESFREKGRFSSLMREFAILTVIDDFAALTGCAGYLAESA